MLRRWFHCLSKLCYSVGLGTNVKVSTEDLLSITREDDFCFWSLGWRGWTKSRSGPASKQRFRFRMIDLWVDCCSTFFFAAEKLWMILAILIWNYVYKWSKHHLVHFVLLQFEFVLQQLFQPSLVVAYWKSAAVVHPLVADYDISISNYWPHQIAHSIRSVCILEFTKLVLLRGVNEAHFLVIFDETSEDSTAAWEVEALLDVGDYFSLLFLL